MESMRKSLDLMIVSAYGRGHWLAGELARHKWNVHLVDVTDALGAWTPEDWEGPWGFFDTPELTPSQRSRLAESDHAYRVPGGFTVWLPQGPLELNGELSTFHSRAFSIPEQVRTYLQPPVVAPPRTAPEPEALESESASVKNEAAMRETGASERPLPSVAKLWFDTLTGGIRRSAPLKGREKLHRKVSALGFEDAWLAHFAHTIASNVFAENPDTLHYGGPLPLSAPYSVRHVTRESFEQSLVALEELGVKITRNASVNDVRITNKVMDAVEVAAGRRGVERARAFVWLLSSGESEFLSESVVRTLFPSGALKPSWYWSRFRFRLRENTASRALPLGCTILGNVCLPWTHSNCIFVKRLRAEKGEADIKIDVWIRVPVRSLGDQEYFDHLRQELISILDSRIPLSAPECESMPSESRASEASKRAMRFPVFEAREIERMSVARAKNLFVDGPEFWGGYDWLSQLRSSRAVFVALEKLRQQWEAAERREGVRP